MADVTTLPPVPPDLAARGIGLRPETAEDAPFLRALYAAGRRAEMNVTGWPPEMIAQFLGQQFDLQTRHYRTHYKGAAWGVITLDGEPVGRLYLHQGKGDLRIIDIAVAPEQQSQGIGAGLIGAVFEMGRRAGTGVSIHVEEINHGARRLYERLGFRQTGTQGIHLRMDWFPAA